MKWVSLLFAVGTVAAMVQVDTSAKAASTHANSKLSTTKSTNSHSTTKSSTGKRAAKSSRRTRPAAPSYQLHPDAERYKQIQQALADHGYFKGEVNGQWGDDSIDALKRFQADQKLPNDGKISALALIGLGLGPKHDNLTGATVPSASTPANQSGVPATGAQPDHNSPPGSTPQ